MADRLQPNSLNWALTHILRFGDTDIFPVPFEYKAIEHSWDSLRDNLIELDISEYETRAYRRFLVPKPRGGYRVALQLDPIDTILYTAMVYEVAEQIEQSRVSIDQRVACAYRVDTDANGQFFRERNGWPDFHDQSETLYETGNFDYVLIADIADFYNQISHHRVGNALEYAGVSSERAKNLEDFLMSLTALQSRGIPVGPSASILLSEAVLNDVDMFLMRKGFTHTRYSDDFRIFCEDRSEAYRALHDLSEYLYTSHRLTLQSSKTKPIPMDDFVENILMDPEKLEEQGKTEKLNELVDILQEFIFNQYSTFDGELTIEEIMDNLPEEEMKLVRENIVDLFDSCLDGYPLHLGLARYLLRRATSLQTGVLQDQVLENLEVLAPVMRDVAKYLKKSMRRDSASTIGEGLIKFCKTSDISFIPFVRLWIASVFLEKLTTEFEESILDHFEEISYGLGIRPVALLAYELSLLDWVREQRETWTNHNPWDRRAIVWTAHVLPRVERNYWLNRIQGSADLLENVVVRAVRGGIRIPSRG